MSSGNVQRQNNVARKTSFCKELQSELSVSPLCGKGSGLSSFTMRCYMTRRFCVKFLRLPLHVNVERALESDGGSVIHEYIKSTKLHYGRLDGITNGLLISNVNDARKGSATSCFYLLCRSVNSSWKKESGAASVVIDVCISVPDHLHILNSAINLFSHLKSTKNTW